MSCNLCAVFPFNPCPQSVFSPSPMLSVPCEGTVLIQPQLFSVTHTKNLYFEGTRDRYKHMCMADGVRGFPLLAQRFAFNFA